MGDAGGLVNRVAIACAPALGPYLPAMDFVSRAGQKLHHALVEFQISAAGKTCADLGSNTGGFTDCLLQSGATKVYALDTGYGVLDYKLRKDPRVVVMERTNAMHATLPEPVNLVTIDVAWTKQKHILPAARTMLAPRGEVVTLIKPHYEADAKVLRKGVLPPEQLEGIVEHVKEDIADAGFELIGITTSPIKGAKGNIEMLAHLRPT
jgi:23S rRNA (cytidine1920-2'-O)/16S rRNA (cytidine1409-2'-O)-methyltransferase